MNIQWYPGHMTKAKRAMQEDVRLVDLIIELLDARAPLSSRNPDIDELGKGKARLVLLNKADLANGQLNAAWEAYFRSKGCITVKLDARNRNAVRAVNAAVEEACREKKERNRKRGILNRPMRAMVAGIPNVGKSTFINSFAGKASAKTGNKPGVTRGNQWIRLNQSLELLDTPGILWPRFDDRKVGQNLAFLGSIHDEILNKEELAPELLLLLMEHYPEALLARYGIQEPCCGDTASAKPLQLLARIAERRGCLLKGGEPDLSRAAAVLIDDFRAGRLGRITLEAPEGRWLVGEGIPGCHLQTVQDGL